MQNEFTLKVYYYYYYLYYLVYLKKKLKALIDLSIKCSSKIYYVIQL